MRTAIEADAFETFAADFEATYSGGDIAALEPRGHQQ